MESIIPVLLGADLNAYNLARAFHEAYGVKSHAFGRYAVSATKYSRIIDFHIVPKMTRDDILVKTLTDFAASHSQSRLILIGCTDEYAGLVVEHEAELSRCFFIRCPRREHWETLSKKAEFYKLCDRFGILYPQTVVIAAPAGAGELSPDALGFPYPIIVKPSSSVEYWKHPFDGMKKVYAAKTPDAAAKIVADIYASGYGDKMILQKFIEGGDDGMRVLTCYSGADAKVRMTALGHVLLEEHTPKGLGNHCAIITEPNPALSDKIAAMLEAVGYTGFSNFDLKFDPSDGTYRAFEINLRQGRSNYYVTAAGINLAKLLVNDMEGTLDGRVDCDNKVYWHAIPTSIVRRYLPGELRAEVDALIKANKTASSLEYKPDMRFNFMRTVCVRAHLFRQRHKFKTYYPIQK